MRNVKVVQGQQVIFPLQPSGVLAHNAFDLIRAEDDEVATWQINLSPVFRSGVGSTIFAQPARNAPILATGNIVVIMTWGGGGVKFTTQFAYPINGASFSVSGDNIQVQVVATDNATVFAVPANIPAVQGWASKRSSPTAPEPLIVNMGNLPAPTFLDPWVRAVHVGGTDPAGLITVQFNLVSGPVVFAFPAGTRIERIPVPNDTISVQAAVTAGIVSALGELAFT